MSPCTKSTAVNSAAPIAKPKRTSRPRFPVHSMPTARSEEPVRRTHNTVAPNTPAAVTRP
jgi:hypothetical protein